MRRLSAILIWLLPYFAVAFSSNQKPIPITVLSGFLGSGKTTLLQNLLQNKEGMKIALVVNDVASVNIDSKLVASDTTTPNLGTGTSDGMVELQNGCACCSLSDELLTSVSELVTMSDLRGDEDQFEHIVIELSGVADPKAVRAKFQEAVMAQMPLMERVELDTLVTLVDSSMFESHFESDKVASREDTPELFYRDGKVPEKEELEEPDWAKDLPPKLLESVMASLGAASKDDEGEGVTDLLVSQTETADLVVLNKIDLVSENDVLRLTDVVQALNPRAKVVTTSYGNLPIKSVLAVAGGEGVVMAGAVDDHRDYVTAAEDKSLSVDEDCDDPDCTDPTHSHSHSHEHSATTHSHNHEHASKQETEVACTDDSHSHSHDHSCDDPSCTDESHSHSHEHSEACGDPDCTDTSHSHSHDHVAHGSIGTFVYRARRPFHPGRLVSFLHSLPVVRGIPEAKDTEEGRLDIPEKASEALKTCLRSKGFIWCADSHDSAMYWSHAGTSFELSCLGQWWATLPRSQWPPDVDEYVLQDFDIKDHDDATNPVGVGDRRQEVVFIGPKYGGAECQRIIRETLNGCLLDDQEFEEYKSIQSDEGKLRSRFANAIEAKMLSY